MRIIIVFDGYLLFGKCPTSKDAFDVFPYRIDLFSRSLDEGILLFAHIFMFLLLPIGIALATYISYKKCWKKLYIPLSLVIALIFEITIRQFDFYGYTMWFD